MTPNYFPTVPLGTKRIALIGEAPGESEERIGKPFVGKSGDELGFFLSRAGITRDQCFLGNVSQYRPPNNQIEAFSWSGLQIQHGLERLRYDIEKFNPNVVVLLGNVPLKAAKDPQDPHPLNPKSYKFKNSDWRGSLFIADNGPFAGRKCISTYHPAYELRVKRSKKLAYVRPLLQFDIRRAVLESETNTLEIPVRDIEVPRDPLTAVAMLNQIRQQRTKIGTDIEGYWNNLTTISFADRPTHAVVIPFVKKSGGRYWSPQDEPYIWKAVAGLLEDPRVPKVLQNGLYDRFALDYGHRIRIRGVTDDTMLKWWELYCELPKALDVQVSVLTRQPYYKGDRDTQDDETFYRYNGLDSCVTLEISDILDKLPEKQLPECTRVHYRTNVELQNPLLYMEKLGIRYDSKGAAERRALLRSKMYEAQARLNGLTGHYLSTPTQIFARAREVMGFKRAHITTYEELKANCKKDYQESVERLDKLAKQPPTLANIGEIEDLCEASLCLGSNKYLQDYLYRTLGLPPQYNKDENDVAHETADYEALLRLSKTLTRDNDPRLAIIHLCIEIRALQTRQSMLSIESDPDGRIRCGYNIVGSDTGRITSYKSPTGSGFNLQTIPNHTNPAEAPGGVLGDRDLFRADEDCWFFQCDLKGADGWTVAAYCAMLGDTTMLDDYKAGLSPFNILVLRLRGIQGDYNDRTWLASEVKKIDKNAWDRFAMKRVQHGASYMEGGPTISANILKDSEGKMFLEPNECRRIKEQLFYGRYPGIRLWHNWCSRQVREHGTLTAASGQVHRFFGWVDEILPQIVAAEPQSNTTFVTNLAMHRLWSDRENRLPGNILRVQPLHQVHDALCGQFKKTDTEWACSKLHQWFNNEVNIAGQKITIPFEGGFGSSWGETNNKI